MYLPENSRIGAVELDYLTIGRCWADKDTRDGLLDFARDRETVMGRYRIKSGNIWCDSLKIGRIIASTAGQSRYGWKIKIEFTGSFFRRPERGGAGLTVRDAVWITRGFEARAFIPPELEQAAARLDAARRWAGTEQTAASEALYVEAARDFEQQRAAHEAVPAKPCSYTTIDRLDYCIEVELPDTTMIAHRWRTMPDDSLPGRYQARGMIDEEGVTVYCGTTQKPLKHRGERPLMRVYQYAAPTYASAPSTPSAAERRDEEQAQARRLRIEIECPRVINVNPARTMGEDRAAQLAGELLGGALGLGALPVVLQGTPTDDLHGLAVPALDLGADLEGISVPGTPYVGHAHHELRRLVRCGLGNVENVLKTQITMINRYAVGAAPDIEVVREVMRPTLELDELDEMLDLILTARAVMHPSAPRPDVKDAEALWDHRVRTAEFAGRYVREDQTGTLLAHGFIN